MISSREAARRWNRQARRYDAMTAPMERLMGFDRGRSWLAARLPDRARVLEIGAGTGRNLPYYPPGTRLVATDLSEAMLRRAVTRAAGAGPAPRFVVADAEHLPFRDGAFDAVLATFVFCSVPDALAGLAEARRVLRRDGTGLFLEHVRPGGWLGRLFDVLDPLVSRFMGPHINRRTMEALTTARLRVFDQQTVFSDWITAVAVHREE
jgi:ubiquinone/menaquinone biosynthesis C-methylase UbiE